MTKFTFFLMTQKGYEVLNAFIDKFGVSYIDCIICSRDNNIEKDYYDEIINICIKNQIKYYDKSENIIHSGDFFVAISWRWIINITNSRLIVLHDSLLPRYRGFAPLVNALLNKEPEIGVTALFANEEYDKGEIILQKKTLINYPLKIAEAIQIISKLYIEIVIEVCSILIKGEKIVTTKQDESIASYSLWLNDDDYQINWHDDAENIERFINSVGFPYKGACTYMNNKKVRIIDAHLEKDIKIENRKPGKVIFIKEGFPIIVCGKNLLKVTKMIDDTSKESLIPLTNFRIIFNNN